MKYRIKVVNKKRSPDFGETDFEKGTIKINKAKSKVKGKKTGSAETLDTIYHEKLHADHPKMTEKQVRKKAKRFTKTATRKQKSKVYNLANNQFYVPNERR